MIEKEQYSQTSLLPEDDVPEKSCFRCCLFAELKEPFVRSDEAVIYGYCFQAGDRNDSPGMGKGFAVFLPEGMCGKFKSKNARTGGTI